jgi:hypothetical protein
LVKESNKKVVPNILIYLHAKFHIFLRCLSISFQFILTCLENQIEKRIKKWTKGVLGHFPPRRPNATAPWPNPAHETPARYRSRATVTTTWDPPVGVICPQFSLLCARVATPVKFPPLSQPLITTSAPQCRRLCTRALEPSHRLLLPCSVMSMLPAALLCCRCMTYMSVPGAR